MIFNYVNNINKMSKISEGILRISMDTKATIKVGQFSRGGYCRYSVKAWDHDYEAEATLKLFGINIPETGANHFYVTDNNATSDFMVDALEHLYPKLKKEFAPHTLVINMDNGPENNSRRSQFMKRLVDFAETESINISLAYYPPYHSKYNPIERVWGVLERHWNGELLDSVEKVLGLARTMTWKGNKPIVNFVNKFYEKSVCLSQKAMQLLEFKLDRVPEIEKWAVDIPFYGI